jgi:hypothetical protein
MFSVFASLDWQVSLPFEKSVTIQQKRTRSQLDDLIGSNVVANSFWATLRMY